MLNELYYSLFSQRDSNTQAKQDTDTELLKARLVAATKNTSFISGDEIQARIDTVRELDSLLAGYAGVINYSWRCYVSGLCWTVYKDAQGSKITVSKI